MWFSVKLLQILIIAALSVVAVRLPAAELLAEPLVKELIVTAAAWERLQGEYRALVASGRLTPGQQREFSRYLGDLGFRVSVQCREVLRRYSDADREQLPCDAMASQVGMPGDPVSEQTPQEEVAALDAVLMDGLGAFDEMLLTEQRKIASRTPRSGGSSGGGAAGNEGVAGRDGGSGETGDHGEGNGDPTQGGSEQEASAGEEPGEAGKGAGKPGSGKGAGGGGKGGNAPPEDVPDGKGDDVVARQLREAAMKEQDPELRRKLWDEYKRYKASTR
jgi:hypothetical protein